MITHMAGHTNALPVTIPDNTSQFYALGYVMENHIISKCEMVEKCREWNRDKCYVKIPLELIEKLQWDFF